MVRLHLNTGRDKIETKIQNNNNENTKETTNRMGILQGLTIESTVGDRSSVGFLNVQDYRKNPERKQSEKVELLKQAQAKHDAGLQTASVLYTAIIVICLAIAMGLGISLISKKKQLRRLKAKKRKLTSSTKGQKLILSQDRNRRIESTEMTDFMASPPNYGYVVAQQQQM